ncbi:MAG: DUF2147 domain-containing protein [Hyphomicrobiaceae bacterium]
MAIERRSVTGRRKFVIGAAVGLAAVLAVMPALARKPAHAAIPPGPVGLWIDHTGRGAVEIAQCEGKATLCGWIVWLKDPLDKRGKPLRDQLNEERAKRNRPICGLQILGELKQQRDGSWDLGWIYDPERGEAFDAELRMRGTDRLQVTGYKGFKFLSETFQWRRATDPVPPRCTA